VKAYVYSPAEAGLAAWPSGELRLDGFDQTSDPDEADVFVVPGNLSLFQENGILNKERLYRLPYLAGNENRTVVFDVSDNFTKPICMPLIFLRCDMRTWMTFDDPCSVPMPWPVEDYESCVEVPPDGFKYDVSFQGWLSTDTRTISSQACKETPELKCDIATYSDFCGYLHDRATNQWTGEGVRRRTEFRRSMKESRICLCPESIPGVLPYRFFEAMSAGRVPLLVSSDYCLPFEREIPYDEFIITLPRENAHEAGQVALDFVRRADDEEVDAMGAMARFFWKKWLNCADWPRTMAYAVKAQLEHRAACALR
jgi:hypothetical protein